MISYEEKDVLVNERIEGSINQLLNLMIQILELRKETIPFFHVGNPFDHSNAVLDRYTTTCLTAQIYSFLVHMLILLYMIA